MGQMKTTVIKYTKLEILNYLQNKQGYNVISSFIHSSIGLKEDFKKTWTILDYPRLSLTILDYIKRSFGTQVTRATVETIPNVQINHRI